VIELTPQRSGDIAFACAMNMVTLIDILRDRFAHVIHCARALRHSLRPASPSE
jgi:hypothetical protein